MNIQKEKIFEMGYVLLIEFLKHEGWRVSEETKEILISTYGFTPEETIMFQEAVHSRQYFNPIIKKDETL